MATTLAYSPGALDFGLNALGVTTPTQMISLIPSNGTAQITSFPMSNSDFALVSPPALPFNVGFFYLGLAGISQQIHSITRTSGNFITDGWIVGTVGVTTDSGSNSGKTFTITNVATLVLTIAETFNVQTSGQVGICLLASIAQQIEINFTPSTLGIEPGILTVGWTGGTSLQIPLVGICGYPYVQYTLPPILNRPCGIINCYMFIDTSVSSIIIPSAVRFLDIGEIVEKVDAEAGTTDIENVDITLAEDYTTYPEGFFYKLLIENPLTNVDFMFTLINGANEEFLYRGTVYRQGSEVPEYYLDNISSPGSWVRGMKVQLVSPLLNLQNIDTPTFCAVTIAHFVQMEAGNIAGQPMYNFASFTTLFACMMELAFAGNYDESLVINNGDFRVQSTPNIPGTWISWIQGYLLSSWFYPANTTGYNVPTLQPYTYYSNISDCWELLKHICTEFGAIPKYTFGNASGCIDPVPTNNKHRISFNTRGNSGVPITPVGNVVESTLTAETSRKVLRLRATNVGATYPDQSWFWDGVLKYEATAEVWRQFDKEVSVDFDTSQSPAYTSLFQSNGSGICYSASNIEYWDYSLPIPAYVNVDNFCRAIAQYYFGRFSTSRIEYARTYTSLQANNGLSNSQMWMQSLNTTSINDGITARTFYITEIHKDILKNQTTVVWVQI